MSLERQLAIQYLAAEPKGCWRWAEDGAVIVWSDGTTIGFRLEIEEILRSLAPNGLPPFDALVLLLAACREKLPPFPFSDPPTPDSLADPMIATLHATRSQRNAKFEACIQRMKMICTLPRELRTGLKAKCNLAAAVFESCKKLPYADAQRILCGMAEPIIDEELTLYSDQPTSLLSIQLITSGLERHTAESLALRMNTGLDRVPKPAPAELPPPARARLLIDELGRDQEWGVVARAAKDLMAAARLPRRLAAREDLPLGGVSDISNRGPLDRLLLSELAHDDLTLSVRVALNEALFLRREPPTREPPGTLALLLDSGVPMWGIPRVLATSLALALIARERNESTIHAWRANGADIEKVELLTRATLMQHLAALRTDAHVGACLSKFVKSLPVQHQSVVITHREALDEPEFRRALEEHSSVLGFVATVTRDGEFELHRLPLSRRPPHCRAQLDLESIFDGSKPTEVRDIPFNPEWPAIFSVHPFPLLLPITGQMEFWTQAEARTYAVMRDRRLVEFADTGIGGRVLAPNLPAGRTVWMHVVEGALYLVKSGSSNRPVRLVSFPLPYGPPAIVELLHGETPHAFYHYADVLLGFTSQHIHAFSLRTGERLDRHVNHHRHIHGRFFRGDKNLYAATWDGERIRMDELPVPKPHTVADVLHVSDGAQEEGPWMVTRTGFVQSVSSGKIVTMPVPAPITTIQVSQTGQQLVVGEMARPSNQVHVTLNPVDFHSARPSGWTVGPGPTLPCWNIYRFVETVAIDNDELILRGRKGHLRRIEWSHRIIQLVEYDHDGELENEIRFSLKIRTAPGGCSLSCAEWPDGRKAYLDSRGLLHLRSPRPGAPEISLVLSSGEVVGWTSDGLRCGPRFFFEGPEKSDPAAVYRRLREFLTGS